MTHGLLSVYMIDKNQQETLTFLLFLGEGEGVLPITYPLTQGRVRDITQVNKG